MTLDRETARIGYNGNRLGWRVQGVVGKLLALATGAVLLVGAVAISIAVFAAAAAGLLVVGLYVWWKTRDLRKQMRAASSNHAVSNPAVIDGEIIEGEVVERTIIRDVPPRDP